MDKGFLFDQLPEASPLRNADVRAKVRKAMLRVCRRLPVRKPLHLTFHDVINNSNLLITMQHHPMTSRDTAEYYVHAKFAGENGFGENGLTSAEIACVRADMEMHCYIYLVETVFPGTGLDWMRSYNYLTQEKKRYCLETVNDAFVYMSRQMRVSGTFPWGTVGASSIMDSLPPQYASLKSQSNNSISTSSHPSHQTSPSPLTSLTDNHQRFNNAYANGSGTNHHQMAVHSNQNFSPQPAFSSSAMPPTNHIPQSHPASRNIQQSSHQEHYVVPSSVGYVDDSQMSSRLSEPHYERQAIPPDNNVPSHLSTTSLSTSSSTYGRSSASSYSQSSTRTQDTLKSQDSSRSHDTSRSHDSSRSHEFSRPQHLDSPSQTSTNQEAFFQSTRPQESTLPPSHQNTPPPQSHQGDHTSHNAHFAQPTQQTEQIQQKPQTPPTTQAPSTPQNHQSSQQIHQSKSEEEELDLNTLKKRYFRPAYDEEVDAACKQLRHAPFSVDRSSVHVFNYSKTSDRYAKTCERFRVKAGMDPTSAFPLFFAGSVPNFLRNFLSEKDNIQFEPANRIFTDQPASIPSHVRHILICDAIKQFIQTNEIPGQLTTNYAAVVIPLFLIERKV